MKMRYIPWTGVLDVGAAALLLFWLSHSGDEYSRTLVMVLVVLLSVGTVISYFNPPQKPLGFSSKILKFVFIPQILAVTTLVFLLIASSGHVDTFATGIGMIFLFLALAILAVCAARILLSTIDFHTTVFIGAITIFYAYLLVSLVVPFPLNMGLAPILWWYVAVPELKENLRAVDINLFHTRFQKGT